MRRFSNIDNVFCLEHDLNLSQAYVYEWMLNLSKWASHIVIENKVYYFASKTKAVQDLPIVTTKTNTMHTHYKSLEKKGFIIVTKVNKQDFIHITDKSKTWNSSNHFEKNQDELGKKSKLSFEKNPTYSNINTYSNNIDSKHLSKIEISDVDDSLKVYFKIAKKFQELFIKNLKEKKSPTSHQEKAKFKNYVDPIRLMITTDGISKEQILKVYNYLDSPNCETLKFSWKTNILSTKKLREKFQQLSVKANQIKENQEPTYKGNR